MTVVDLPPLTPSQLEQLSSLFTILAPPSSNGSVAPSLGPKEVGFLLRSLGVPSTESEVLDLIAEVDSKGTGTMGFDEFVMVMGRGMDLELAAADEIDDAFKALASGPDYDAAAAQALEEDRKAKGGKPSPEQYVSALNLREAINGMATKGGQIVTKEEVDEMIAEADVDGNVGKIGKEDFKYMMETRHKEIDRKERGGGGGK